MLLVKRLTRTVAFDPEFMVTIFGSTFRKKLGAGTTTIAVTL
jgi:hypothetical protein